jgi:hypothetical protein
VSAPAPAPGLAVVKQKWSQIIERVQAAAPLAKGYLKDAVPARVDGNRVTLSFDPEFADSCEKLKVPRALRAVQTALEWALGQEVVLELTIGRPLSDTEPAPAVLAEPVAKPAGARTSKEWVKDPAVKRTLEAFNGNIVDIRE